MDGDDVRVVERRDGERLAFESLAAIRIGGSDFGQHPQCDIALEPRIARPIHLTHAPDAEQADDLVGAETGARLEGYKSERIIRGEYLRRRRGVLSVPPASKMALEPITNGVHIR